MLPMLLLAPALVLLQSDPWGDAVAQLEVKLKAQPGIGAVVLAERLDARTVRLRIKSSAPASSRWKPCPGKSAGPTTSRLRPPR
ncbi:MAG: hypothetical protein IPL96_15060 [Holophagaceae bacterium]|nr:hypothetical protein [Holophagaceae bacterium]